MKLKKSVSLILLASSPCALFYKGHGLLYSTADVDLSPLHTSEKLILDNIQNYNENSFAVNESNKHLNSLIEDNKNFKSSVRIVKDENKKHVSLFMVKEKKKLSKAIEILDSIDSQSEIEKNVSKVEVLEKKNFSYSDFKFSFKNDGHDLVSKKIQYQSKVKDASVQFKLKEKNTFSTVDKLINPTSDLKFNYKEIQNFYFGKSNPLKNDSEISELDNSEVVKLTKNELIDIKINFNLEKSIKFSPVVEKMVDNLNTQAPSDGKVSLSTQKQVLKFTKDSVDLVFNDDNELVLQSQLGPEDQPSEVEVKNNSITERRKITYSIIEKKDEYKDQLLKDVKLKGSYYLGEMDTLEAQANAVEINNSNLITLKGFENVSEVDIHIADIYKPEEMEGFLADLEKESRRREEENAKLIAQNKALEERKDKIVLGKLDSHKNSKVDNFKNDEDQIEDFVKTLQASSSGNSDLANNSLETNPIVDIGSVEQKKDDLVFMDMEQTSANEEVLPKEEETSLSKVLAKQMGIHTAASIDRLPTSVSKVIDRELKKSFNPDYPINGMATVADRGSNNSVDSHKQALDRSRHRSGVSENGRYSSFFKKKAVKRDGTVSLDLLGTQVAIDKGFRDDVINFDFIPEFDKNSLISSNSDGVVEINSNLNNKFGVFRGTILQRGIVRTKVDISLKNGNSSINVPLLTVDDFENFLEKENLNAIGGNLLLELDNKVDDVDIDKPFEAKIYLNEEFKTVFDDKWKYIMFVGIAPGNTLVSLKTGNESYSEKIVQISENEILYNQIALRSSGLKRLSLAERNTMGKVNSDLNFGGENLSYFNTKNKGTRIGLNSYEYLRPPIPVGAREYLELNHLKEPIFLGKWDQKKAEIPSNRFISQVLDFFLVDELDGMCMVQINLEKEATDISIEGDTGTHSLNFRDLYLDKDGLISEEINEMSNKVFIMGEGQGMFNVKIKYLDNTEDYLQTFCSDGTYLVEQL